MKSSAALRWCSSTHCSHQRGEGASYHLVVISVERVILITFQSSSAWRGCSSSHCSDQQGRFSSSHAVFSHRVFPSSYCIHQHRRVCAPHHSVVISMERVLLFTLQSPVCRGCSSSIAVISSMEVCFSSHCSDQHGEGSPNSIGYTREKILHLITL